MDNSSDLIYVSDDLCISLEVTEDDYLGEVLSKFNKVLYVMGFDYVDSLVACCGDVEHSSEGGLMLQKLKSELFEIVFHENQKRGEVFEVKS